MVETKILALEKLKRLPWHSMFYMFYIEPIIFLLVFAQSLSSVIMKNQVIFQACTTVFNYNKSDCELLGTHDNSTHIVEIETEVQQYVVDLFMARTLLESIVPVICGIFIGSWSDHYGRKPLLLVSMIGFSFTDIITAIICELSQYYTVNPWYYIIAAIPHSVLGGNCVLTVAAYCFICDITTTTTRPYRMILLEVALFTGLLSGSLLSSFVYAATNATITMAISGVLVCLTTIFIAIFVPETLHLKSKEAAAEETDKNEQNTAVICTSLDTCCEQIIPTTTNDEKFRPINEFDMEKKPATDKNEAKPAAEKAAKVEAGAEMSTEKPTDETQKERPSLFSYIHIKEMMATCMKRRPCHGRAIIWLATGTMFLSIFVFEGSMAVFYLFVRKKFQWTIRDFTFFHTVNHSVSMLGATIGFLLLRKVFKISVVSMALLAFISDTIMSILRGVAEESWQMYLSAGFGFFRNLGGPMCRTIISNIVPPTDLGKIFSIKNILQSLAPFVAAPLYSFIYKESLEFYPGLFNIVSAVLYAIAVLFLILVLRYKYLHRKFYDQILK